jgi:hypothetical protein
MQIANCRLILHDNGNDVAKTYVTPAQVAILRRMFTSTAKKDPITDLKILPGEAASFDKPAEYYDTDVLNDDDTIKFKAGSLKSKATLRLRTDAEEVARLRRMYHKTIIEQVFPGLNPTLPKTFDEVKPEPLTQDQKPMDAVWTDEATFVGKEKPVAPPAPPK